MPYVIDTAQIKIADYKELLKTQTLLPSRQILLNNIDENVSRLQSQGIETVSDLLRALASPAKIAELAEKSAIPANYLKILKREAGTLKPKRVLLRDFPDVDPALIESLRKQNISTASDYMQSGLDENDELYCLCTLSQINGVGPNAARMLYNAGYHTPGAVAAANANTMLDRISADNAAHRYYQGTLGEKDMQFCIDFAKTLEKYRGILS